MAAIAATLLCYYPADIAFVMLVRLWQDKGLKNFFSQEFDGLMTAFKDLEETLTTRSVGKKLVFPPLIRTDGRRVYLLIHRIMRRDGISLYSIIPFHFIRNYEYGMLS
jgi:hypothetical protein